jgi:phosphoglycolate phosphatase
MIPKIWIFDFDGTISLLRSNWVDIMQSQFELELGNSIDKYPELRQAIRNYILESAGAPSIQQMEQINVFKAEYAADVDRKNSAGYKKHYESMLDVELQQKYAKIQANVNMIDLYLVPGVKAFLQHILDAGSKIYLASGTDKKHVQHETHLLNLSVYFTKIYGPSDENVNATKGAAIDDISNHEQVSNTDMIVVGDGPEEIRQAFKRSIPSIGIVYEKDKSLQKYKTKALENAGATFIINDFTSIEDILKSIGNI